MRVRNIAVTNPNNAPADNMSYSGRFLRYPTIGPSAASRAPWAGFLNRSFGGFSSGDLPSYLASIPQALRNHPAAITVRNQN